MTKATPRPRRKGVAARRGSGGVGGAKGRRASTTPRNKQQRGVGVRKGRPDPKARGSCENEQRWNDNFKKLAEYKRRNGHCNVPTKGNPLGRWVKRQRESYRDGKLENGRFDRLVKLDFSWDRDKDRWEENCKKLVEFKKEHGHCRVPVEGSPLGCWVDNMRTSYRNGKLAKGRLDRLNGLNFSWDPDKDRWEENYEKLVEYKRRNGHCNVPANDSSLGNWVRSQRGSSRNGTLSKGRIDRLRGIGFEWQLRRARKTIETDAPGNEGPPTENSEGGGEEQTDGQEYMPFEEAELSSGHFTAASQAEAEDYEDEDGGGEEGESDAESTKEEYKDLCKKLTANCEEKISEIKALRREREEQKAEIKLLEMELARENAIRESAVEELDKSKVTVYQRRRPTQTGAPIIDEWETLFTRKRGYSIS